jgi:hypothetical protein
VSVPATVLAPVAALTVVPNTCNDNDDDGSDACDAVGRDVQLRTANHRLGEALSSSQAHRRALFQWSLDCASGAHATAIDVDATRDAERGVRRALANAAYEHDACVEWMGMVCRAWHCVLTRCVTF